MPTRTRITFNKTDAMRYIGHLDLFRSWERIFRRSGIPLAYTQGFHPQPRLNLACALPLGFTSECEILDAWLESDLAIDEILASLQPALTPGLSIRRIESVALDERALQTEVRSALYHLTLLDSIPDLEQRLEKIIHTEQLPRRRRDKPYDLRPLIEALSLLSPDEEGRQRFSAQLAAREGSTGRPEELLDEMGIQFADTRVHRVQLLLEP